jgi:hypothetical protein
MKIIPGQFYFIKDEFFTKLNDTKLSINKTSGKRPHYYCFLDEKTKLYWMVPLSSQINKYRKIIKQLQNKSKNISTIKIIKINNRESVFLFQNMFPVIEKYISNQWFLGGKVVYIANPKLKKSLLYSAKRTLFLIKKTNNLKNISPNIYRIEQIMLQELKQKESNNHSQNSTPKNNSL